MQGDGLEDEDVGADGLDDLDSSAGLNTYSNIHSFLKNIQICVYFMRAFCCCIFVVLFGLRASAAQCVRGCHVP